MSCHSVSAGPLSAGPDIAPQFAGVIWGLAGSVGNLTGVLAPTVAALMTPNVRQRWSVGVLMFATGVDPIPHLRCLIVRRKMEAV